MTCHYNVIYLITSKAPVNTSSNEPPQYKRILLILKALLLHYYQ